MNKQHASPPAPNTTIGRYHYMDNLRAYALILGVFFHASMAYMPMLENTYVLSDPDKSEFLQSLALFSHLFRMPLFMLVAGFFAHYLFVKRQAGGFLKNRSIRVLLPLLVFFPILIAAVIAIIYLATSSVTNKAPMLVFLMENFAPGSNAEPPPMSSMHLWFLFNLMVFYATAMIWIRFSPLNLSQWLCRLHSAQLLFVLLVVVPAIVALGYFTQPIPPLTPPDKFYPQWWSFANYGVFFLLGWVLFAQQSLFDKIQQHSMLFIATSIMLYSLVYYFYPDSVSIESIFKPDSQAVPTLQHLLMAGLQALITTFMTYALLQLGKQYLSLENKLMRYFSDASYWIYLSHVPIVMLAQMYLVDSDLNVWLKFLITALSAIIVCTLTYQLLVRHTVTIP